MSSNGGWVRFIVMYHVRSPERTSRRGFNVEDVAYWRSTFEVMPAISPSSSPEVTFWKMSFVFVFSSKSNLSGKFSRAFVVSVDGS